MEIEYDDNFWVYENYSNLPCFNINNDIIDDDFYNMNSDKIAQLIYEAALKLIGNDFLEIQVCKLQFPDNKRGTAILNRDNFNETLNICLKIFEKLEQYEKCAKVLELLKME